MDMPVIWDAIALIVTALWWQIWLTEINIWIIEIPQSNMKPNLSFMELHKSIAGHIKSTLTRNYRAS